MRKPIIGIVGGIGSGKSTVAKEFMRFGGAIIDADKLNHQVLEQADIKAQLKQWHGDTIFDPSGRVNRKALGKIVWADPAAMKQLTDLVHPLILAEQESLLKQYQEDTNVALIILDVPLLLEIGWKDRCDAVIFVETDEAIRQERLRENRGWMPEMLKNAENFQFALDIKAKMYDYIVRNNSGISELAGQVEKILSSVWARKQLSD